MGKVNGLQEKKKTGEAVKPELSKSYTAEHAKKTVGKLQRDSSVFASTFC